LESFAAQTLWHEVFIFLLEAHSHCDDHPQRDALLEYLFPALHSEEAPSRSAVSLPDAPVEQSDKPVASSNAPQDRDAERLAHPAVTQNTETGEAFIEVRTEAPQNRATVFADPLMPVAAVELLVKLAWDKDLAIPQNARQRWWVRLWKCRLCCTTDESNPKPEKNWHIAIHLLRREDTHTEIMRCLAEAIADISCNDTVPLPRALSLQDCYSVTSESLIPILRFKAIEELILDGCIRIQNTDFLGSLTSLRTLSLERCQGLDNQEAFQGLAALGHVENLSLGGCVGLTDTLILANLKSLKRLLLHECTGLTGHMALRGLIDLPNLYYLTLSRCIGIDGTKSLSNLHSLEVLYMRGCTGLTSIRALEGFRNLLKLTKLYLSGCTGLKNTDALRGLTHLWTVDLQHCTGLVGQESIAGISRLPDPGKIILHGCSGLTPADVTWLRQQLPSEVEVYGP
jgi:hypothetical protein